MKILFTPILGLLMMLSTQAQAQSFESAKDAVKNMGVGWNLGNTLDAHDATKTWTTTEEHETCWGQPVTKPELMKMMKEAGFGAIRVPVTWYQEIDSNGKINEAWLKRVKEVVDYVIDNGMYCILNIHHDTGHDNEPFKSWIKADESNYQQNKEKFEYIWQQIAETFKDYDQHLLFEAYNEMLDAKNCWNYASSIGTYDANAAKKSYDAINNYAQSFVNVVRSTGGNNASRNLIVNTYAASIGSDQGNGKEVLDQFKVPTDPAKDHIAVEVHQYPSIASGFDSGKSGIDWAFKYINEKIITGMNVPVIIGEWGSSNVDAGAGKTDYDLRKADYLKFVDYWIKKSKELNIASFYWMGLSNGSARELPAFNQPDIVETMLKAYYGKDYSGIIASIDDYDLEYTVTYEQEWAEAFIFGDWSSSVKLSDYKDITVETDAPYGETMQIKVYGDAQGNNNYKLQEVKLSAESNTTTATFDASLLGTNLSYVMLQTCSGAKTVKVKNVTLTKADGTIIKSSVAKGWGCEVKSEYTKKEDTGIHNTKTNLTEVDDAIYNLQGQRITSPRKGIYIQNGKKYISK